MSAQTRTASRTPSRTASRNLTRLLGLATLAAAVFAVIQGLVIMGPTVEQGDYSRLLVVHPPLATTTYLAFGVTALASLLYLVPRTRRPQWDQLAGASAEIGVVFCALTLATGSIWGKPTWGVWWTWDARLTSTALLLALFLGYLALRRVPAGTEVRAKRAAVAALFAALDMPIVHYATKWWQTLHQGQTIRILQPDKNLSSPQLVGMLAGFLTMALLYCWLLAHRYRVEQLEQRLENEGLAIALEQRRAEAHVPVPTPAAATAAGSVAR
jgi:heme exporter protein C